MKKFDIKDKVLLFVLFFLMIVYLTLTFYDKVEEKLLLLKYILPVIFSVLIFYFVRKKTNNYINISKEYLFDISISITNGLFISSFSFLFILNENNNKEMVWLFFIISIILIFLVILYFYLKVKLFNDIFHLFSELLMNLSLNGIVIGLFIAVSKDFKNFYETSCIVTAVSLFLMSFSHISYSFSVKKEDSKKLY